MNEDNKRRQVSVLSLKELTHHLRLYQKEDSSQHYECPYFSVASQCKASMQPLINKNAPWRMNFMRVVILLDSWSEPVLNFQKVRIEKGDMFLANWGVIIQPESVVPDLTFSGFTLTEEYLNIIYGNSVPMLFSQHNQHFVLRLTDEERKLALDYLAMLIKILRLPRVNARTVNSIFVTLLNFTQSIYEKTVMVPRQTGSQAKKISEKFLELTNEHAKTHHDVEYYASELCVTGHYLGILVKQETGETPKTWIDKKLLIALQVDLKYTDKSIKGLAKEYCFPAVSALCKFFKRKMGMTPNQYRETAKE